MEGLWTVMAAATLIAPGLMQEQAERTRGPRQSMSMASNFRIELGDCTLQRQGDGFAVSGAGRTSVGSGDSDEGTDLAVTTSDGVVPSVAAHAINTKGTGATNHRLAEQRCGLVPSPTGTIPAGRAVAAPAATCTVSGDPDAPDVRFTVPLSLFGGTAKEYVGHVTLMKRTDTSQQARSLSKKGYDYYRASSDMGLTVVATCDASALSAKSGAAAHASYDLAVNKKA